MALCPYCAGELETPSSCAACKRPLEVDERATPYELFGIPLAFDVDTKDLRRRSLRISRDIHPDFFGTAGDDVRALAERNSARLNGAFDVLADDAARADWIVRHLGGPDEQTERAMPQAFLMEVLEWNEVLEEARASTTVLDPRLAALRTELEARRSTEIAAVRALLTQLPARASTDLKRVRQHLNAVRYVDRALGDIETLRLARASTH